MQDDLGAENVYLLYDDTKQSWPGPSLPSQRAAVAPLERRPETHILLFNEEECQAVNDRKYWTYNEYWQETAMLLFFTWLDKEFSYIWSFEDDVRCNGHFSKCLAPLASVTADLVCIKITAYDDYKAWFHWDTIGGELLRLPKRYPLCRHS